MDKQQDNWLPLQSNPEVMTNFIKQLGVNTQKYSVQDLLSTQQWAQQMLGRPVLGLIFLFQISQLQKQYQKVQSQSLQTNKVSQNIFFMKQYAKNACGTIALFHIIMNNIYEYQDLVNQNSYLSKFNQDTFGKDYKEKGIIFQGNKQICQKHKESVKKGSTKVTNKVDTHFIAFVQKDGFLYQLDGRKKEPINHGQCSQQGLTFMSCIIINKFMMRDPQNNKYTILALAQKPQF